MFKASLVYRESSRRAKATQKNPVLKKQTKREKKKNQTNNKEKQFKKVVSPITQRNTQVNGLS